MRELGRRRMREIASTASEVEATANIFTIVFPLSMSHFHTFEFFDEVCEVGIAIGLGEERECKC